MTDGTMAPASPERDWMTTDEFKAWFARLGLSESELARRLDVTQPTINRWSTGQRKPPGYLWRALEHLEEELERRRRPAQRSGGEQGAGTGGQG
jgi:DNA-binding transcriptional regulator YiaG